VLLVGKWLDACRDVSGTLDDDSGVGATTTGEIAAADPIRAAGGLCPSCIANVGAVRGGCCGTSPGNSAARGGLRA
jgi:hypothetical protein